MSNQGHFEKAKHQMPDGNPAEIPVYVGEHSESLPESKDLLRVAEIIGSTLGGDDFMTLEELTVGVEEIIANPTVQGILIEDDEGAEAVAITNPDTTLLVRGIGRKVLPTTLVSDMLHAWPQAE